MRHNRNWTWHGGALVFHKKVKIFSLIRCGDFTRRFHNGFIHHPRGDSYIFYVSSQISPKSESEIGPAIPTTSMSVERQPFAPGVGHET